MHVLCLKPCNGFDPVCLATARKRAKRAKEPRVKHSTTTQTKTPEVGKSQDSSSSDCNFQDLQLQDLQFTIFKPQSIEFCKAITTRLLLQSVNQVSYLKQRYFSNQEHS